jgi:hypothetical protein
MDIVPRGLVIGVVILVIAVVAFFLVKRIADSAATSATETRAAEVQDLLNEATPEDFLEFNSGSQTEGTVAADMADEDDFVSVVAEADHSVARFQPSGWWQGFTERCIVAVVTNDAVEVDTPKVACIRIDPADYGS